MATKLKTGFGAIGYSRVEVIVIEDSPANKKRSGEKTEQEIWVGENCEGRYFVSVGNYVGNKTYMIGFLFESEFDMMAFKLRFG